MLPDGNKIQTYMSVSWQSKINKKVDYGVIHSSFCVWHTVPGGYSTTSADIVADHAVKAIIFNVESYIYRKKNKPA